MKHKARPFLSFSYRLIGTKLFPPLFLAALLAYAGCKPKHRSMDPKGGSAELEQLNQAISDHGSEATYLLKRSDYYAKRGSIELALADASQAEVIEKNLPEAYFKVSDLQLLLGKPQPALEELRKVLAFDPRNTQALNKMGNIYLVMKDYENCAKTIQQSLSIEPDQSGAFLIKGLALLESKHPKEAVESFNTAVLLDPKNCEAYLQLGYLHKEKNAVLATEYFKSATNADPASEEALYNLGMMYQQQDESDKAEQCYIKLLKLNPNQKNAIYNLGYINLVFKQDFAKAEGSFAAAIHLDSLYTDAWFNRGYAFELMGRKQDARNCYQQVLHQRPNDAKAIDALHRLGK